MKPIIGFMSRVEKLESGKEIYYVNKESIDAILKHGGIPLIISTTKIDNYYNRDINTTSKMNEEEINDLITELKLCDGFILQGGDDFYYHELILIDYAYKHDIPLLGYCLGMQSIGYYFGSDLIKAPDHYSKDKYVHDINIKEDTLLYDILKTTNTKVNSRHHYMITSPNIVICATNNEVIEAIEDSSKKFFIGLQWHPESMIEYDTLENNLFKQFIEACKRK